MPNNRLWKKGLVVVIIILFIGAGVIPGISGINVKKMNSLVNHFEYKYSDYSQEIVINGENIKALIVGSIYDLKTEGDKIKFKCGPKIFPFPLFLCRIYPIPSIKNYQHNYPFWLNSVTISKQKIGIITPHFICAICTIIPPSTKVTLKDSIHDDIANTIVWEVTKVEGDPIGEFNLRSQLWSDNYSAWIWSQDQISEDWGNLTVGDTITIQVNPSGYYHTRFTDRVSLVPLTDDVIVNY